jgi:hypothetical protein
MPSYKWSSPADWLHDQIQSAGEDELHAYLNAIIPTLDSDTIQDLFENEMDADGYFEAEHEHRPVDEPRDDQSDEYEIDRDVDDDGTCKHGVYITHSGDCEKCEAEENQDEG